jgi:hypothetical protein
VRFGAGFNLFPARRTLAIVGVDLVGQHVLRVVGMQTLAHLLYKTYVLQWE